MSGVGRIGVVVPRVSMPTRRRAYASPRAGICSGRMTEPQDNFVSCINVSVVTL